MRSSPLAFWVFVACALLVPAATAQPIDACVPPPLADAVPANPIPSFHPEEFMPYRTPAPDAPPEAAALARLSERVPAFRLLRASGGHEPDAVTLLPQPAAGNPACPTAEIARAPSETGTGWRMASRRDAEYDAEGRLTRLTQGVMNGADLAITKVDRSSYSYDEHGRLATVVYESTQEVGVPIERVLRETYAYRPDGRLAGIAVDTWSGTTWDVATRVSLRYGAGFHAEGVLVEWLNGTTWVPDTRISMAYDGLLPTVEALDGWTGAGWAPLLRTDYAYEGGRLREVAYASASGAGGLAPTYRWAFTYTVAGAPARLRVDLYEGGAWREAAGRTFEYDAAGRLVASDNIQDDGGGLAPSDRNDLFYGPGGLERSTWAYRQGSVWHDGFQTAYHRDGVGRLAERTIQRKNGSEWEDYGSLLRAYGGAVTAEPPAAGLAPSLTLAPNPASSETTVRFTLDRPSPVRLAIYDVLGRRVLVAAREPLPAGEQALPVDVTALAAGTYLARLAGPDWVLTHRFTVVR